MIEIEKLTDSITIKCTYEDKRDFEAIAKAEKSDISKLGRECIRAKILEVKEYLNSLSSIACLTTDTRDTDFELIAPPRLIDVTPKPTGTKKVQLLQQKDFFAVHSDK